MNRVFVHVDRLVVADASFDVQSFKAALQRGIAASWSGHRQSGVGAIRVPPVQSGKGSDVGAAVARSMHRRLQ